MKDYTMLNTYGVRSVNRETFNTNYRDNHYYPRSARNVVVTALRIHNAVLNVLGYIPGLSLVSGCIRMSTGLAIVGVTLTIGDRKACSGTIIGRWYDEAIGTGIAQVVRGALEALVPFGWIANAVLDLVATPMNLAKEVQGSVRCEGCMMGAELEHSRPHDDVSYLFPLGILHLA